MTIKVTGLEQCDTNPMLVQELVQKLSLNHQLIWRDGTLEANSSLSAFKDWLVKIGQTLSNDIDITKVADSRRMNLHQSRK